MSGGVSSSLNSPGGGLTGIQEEVLVAVWSIRVLCLCRQRVGCVCVCTQEHVCAVHAGVEYVHVWGARTCVQVCICLHISVVSLYAHIWCLCV